MKKVAVKLVKRMNPVQTNQTQSSRNNSHSMANQSRAETNLMRALDDWLSEQSQNNSQIKFEQSSRNKNKHVTSPLSSDLSTLLSQSRQSVLLSNNKSNHRLQGLYKQEMIPVQEHEFECTVNLDSTNNANGSSLQMEPPLRNSDHSMSYPH